MNTPLEHFVAALVRSSLSAVVLMLLVLGAQRLFRQQLSPQARCALWLLVVVRLIPFSWPSDASIFNWLPRWPSGANRFETGRNVSSQPIVSDAAIFDTTGSRGPVAEERGSRLTPASRATAWPWSWATLAFTVWLAGATALTGYVVTTTLMLRRSLARARRVDDPAVLALLHEVSVEMEVRRGPAVFESDAVGAPTLYGLFCARLILPVGFTDMFSAAEQRLVFLHEFAHLRRRDLPLNWVVTTLQIVHWFNPFLWLGLGRWRGDREIACDAGAIAKAGSSGARIYGETMLRILEQMAVAPPRAGLVGILENKRQLHRRIRSIAGPTSSGRPVVPVALIALLGVSGLTDAQVPGAAPTTPAVAPAAVASDHDRGSEPKIRRETLSSDQVKVLEDRVQRDPKDLATRLQLLQYYSHNQYSSAVARTAHQ